MSQISRLVVIMGPTGAGKSALALDLAREHGGEILNADSRQVYQGMDIGTDKATLQARIRRRDQPVLVAGIPHYLIDILTPDQRYSAAEFRDDAWRIIADIQRRGKLPLVVGGTGFYIRVLTGGQQLPNVPADPVFRAWAAAQSVETLAAKLQRTAPDLLARVDNPRNRRRVTRALEIARAREIRGDTPVLSSRKRGPVPADLRARGDDERTVLETAHVLKLALVPPDAVLRERLAARVDDLLRRGLVEEVRALVARYGEAAPGLQAVGYRQVFPLLRGEATLEETRMTILRAHRDYARRQLTWLKKEPAVVRAASADGARRIVAGYLEKSRRDEHGGR